MILTLSERRLSELIRQLEGINDSDEEILFRMQHYAAKLFNQVSEYGIRMVEMVEHHGGIGSFRFDIKGVGMDWQTGGFNWEQLNQGLSFLGAVAKREEHPGPPFDSLHRSPDRGLERFDR